MAHQRTEEETKRLHLHFALSSAYRTSDYEAVVQKVVNHPDATPERLRAVAETCVAGAKGNRGVEWGDTRTRHINRCIAKAANMAADRLEATENVAQVFHADTAKVREAGRSAFDGEAEWPSEYTLAAIVETEEVDVAYELTNHIDREWWDNSGVELVGPKTRSTSTGDVVVIGSRGFKCESCGWSEFEVTDSDRVRASKLR